MKKRSSRQIKPQTKATNSVRIISGQWRRRNLPILDLQGLRPTGDRVRETLFNWLMPVIAESRVLDLFAGTGALGLEAMSRGANFVHFVEKHPDAAKQLQSNLHTLNANQHSYQLSNTDALSWLARSSGEPFDLIFLDPPFADGLWKDCCDLIAKNRLLAPEALIYVESPLETKLITPINWHPHRSLKTGNIHAQLFEVETS